MKDYSKRLEELVDFGLTTGGAGTRASLMEAAGIARKALAVVEAAI